MGVKNEPMTMMSAMSKLKDNNVAKVRIYFDGAGDSGEISEIEALDEDDNYIDLNIYDLLEEWAYETTEDLVNQYGGDWVNNDGGYGYIWIDVKNMTYNANYYQRTTDEVNWDDKEIFF